VTPELEDIFSNSENHIAVLTGAGISAESGIPTFRGPEGFWTIGSNNYHPQEMATYAMFQQHPNEVWRWYLYRLSICKNAKPNAGHYALSEMEQRLQNRFTLITQNVDNLHLQAGNSEQRTFQIHGNVFFMRCINECQKKLYPLPLELLPKEKDETLSDSNKKLLTCPDCGLGTRPHVLWFDECYDEHYFKFESTMRISEKTDLLIIAGTSGATTLPNHMATTVFNNKKTIIDINIEESPFTRMAINSTNGIYLNMTCSEGLAKLMTKIRN